MRLGSDVLLASTRLRGMRVGVVANPASIDQDFTHIVDRVAKTEGVTLGAIFGPQHGFNADLQDNMIETGHAEDRGRRVPIYSLYSETREPTAGMLAGLDALVIDMQDIGARIYTFVYTMANCLRAAARHGVKVFVCDRPNPIGGTEVEGALLRSGFESFVGQFAIPMRHGMTIGELARLFNEHFGIGATLEVVAMKGWVRGQYWDQTGVPWVMPSPNIPTLDTAVVYPGTVLFEGTMLSEGRGTTRPFELVGVPGVDPDAFAMRMNALKRVLPPRGVRADLPEACEDAVRRLPDSRYRAHAVPARRGGRGAAAGVPRHGARPVRVASASVRIRAREAADRHPRRLAVAAGAGGRASAPGRHRRQLARRRGGVQKIAGAVPVVLTAELKFGPTTDKSSALRPQVSWSRSSQLET
jgi:hypothetical protein